MHAFRVWSHRRRHSNSHAALPVELGSVLSAAQLRMLKGESNIINNTHTIIKEDRLVKLETTYTQTLLHVHTCMLECPRVHTFKLVWVYTCNKHVYSTWKHLINIGRVLRNLHLYTV